MHGAQQWSCERGYNQDARAQSCAAVCRLRYADHGVLGRGLDGAECSACGQVPRTWSSNCCLLHGTAALAHWPVAHLSRDDEKEEKKEEVEGFSLSTS